MRTKLPLMVLGFGAAASGFSAPDPKQPQNPNNNLLKSLPFHPRSKSKRETIPGKDRVLNDCTKKRAASIQWIFRKSTACIFKVDWSNIEKEIDPDLVQIFTDDKLRPPDYYNKALVHGMGPLSSEQAQAEEPSMSMLSLALANGVSLYDLSMQIIQKQNFIDPTRPTQSTSLRVVDIGCGTGTLTQKLLATNADQIEHLHGVDASPYKLAKFFKSTPANDLSKVSLHHMLGENLHSIEDRSIDRVLISFVFHELPQTVCRKILNEAWRVLTPGGTIHIVDMDNKNPKIKKLGSTSVNNWLLEPYMDNYLKMDIQGTLSRLNFTNVSRLTLESSAPIAGFSGRKPSCTSSDSAFL